MVFNSLKTKVNLNCI